ncbi:enoyl-CoA hydratase/isomerase family protein [Nocardioides zeae]|uniref:Enoyl-CoA hydratase/isomerase family protein n=1 Tax=Nocardioides imazamoxiresistens TaxID=3231893 RepID=A0ABU3PWR5_9ACTN|nr:enoyl-CoA hydratase/isomerase family protein [Nocardioides zeae]MDT9593277.1 enoyl-CoA hydratase/isomerase family protein [Nocardioides zeae]
MTPEEVGVDLEVRDGVAHLALARPSSANAFDLPTARALRSAVCRIADNDRVGSVLVSGAGARFCAGGDVAAMVGAEDRGAYVRELALVVDEALLALGDLRRPVVAAVQGAVAGAGLALMLSCDVVVAEAGTRFASAYAGVGLTPDCGLSWSLPRAVGQQRALELLLTRRVLDADEARDWGLVTQVAEQGEALGRAHQMALELASGPTYALAQARALVRASWTTTREAAGRAEADVIGAAVQLPAATSRLARFAAR